MHPKQDPHFAAVCLLTFAIACGCTDSQRESPVPPSLGIGPATPQEQEEIEKPGRLGLPLQTRVTLRGTIVQGPHKGSDGGPYFLVRYIDGIATQKDIRLSLREVFGDDGPTEHSSDDRVVRLGETYQIVGREIGMFVGQHPDDRRLIQMARRHLRYCFEVEESRRIPDAEFSPEEFVGREALFDGTARTIDGEPSIVGKNWRLLVRPETDWDQVFIGRRAEVFGKIHRSPKAGVYLVEPAAPQLVELADQKGRNVSLRGTAWSLNGHWWFDYRGRNLYVEDMVALPGWTRGENHGRPMQIDGTLDEADLPDIDQISIVSQPPLRRYFLVRNASWKPLEALLASER